MTNLTFSTNIRTFQLWVPYYFNQTTLRYISPSVWFPSGACICDKCLTSVSPTQQAFLDFKTEEPGLINEMEFVHFLKATAHMLEYMTAMEKELEVGMRKLLFALLVP